jgi:hypothetical protein
VSSEEAGHTEKIEAVERVVFVLGVLQFGGAVSSFGGPGGPREGFDTLQALVAQRSQEAPQMRCCAKAE